MKPEISWQAILNEAVVKPGSILAAYSAFHGYSIGNRMLALIQCHARSIQPGPIAPFKRWKALGRHVRKGEKALCLWLPVTFKRKSEKTDPTTGQTVETESPCTGFVLKPRWFVLSQTAGKEYEAPNVKGWNKDRALAALGVQEESFTEPDGNCQGYAKPGPVISVSPLAALPHKTLFHELAHVVLGHVAETALTDSERTPKSLREVEAESVALICCESLGLEGAEYARGYIQHWLQGQAIPETSARRIFTTAEGILKAGHGKDGAE